MLVHSVAVVDGDDPLSAGRDRLVMISREDEKLRRNRLLIHAGMGKIVAGHAAVTRSISCVAFNL